MSYVANESTVNIANGGTTSGRLDIAGLPPVGLITPAALTSTAITFQVSRDDVTYYTLKSDDGTTYTMTVAASGAYAVAYAKFLGWKYAKMIMGTAEGGARVLLLEQRPI